MQTKTNLITLQMLLGLAVLATPAAAADRASFDIPTTNAPPKIDGDLSDDAWKGALRGGAAPDAEGPEYGVKALVVPPYARSAADGTGAGVRVAGGFLGR